MLRSRARPIVALTLVALVAACAGDGGRRSLTVLAASSLTNAFVDLEAAFEAQHPELDLVVSTGGSPSLAAQASEGAPAAALVTADRPSMQRVVDAGSTTGEPEPVAGNAVTVAAPADPPGRTVESLAELTDDDLAVVLCAPDVPCGRAAVDLLRAADVDVEADSLELSVRGVVSRLELGEADAGVVYRTDVQGSGGALRAVDDDVDDRVGSVGYLAVALAGQAGGRSVVEFLTGDTAQQILADHGFGPP